MEDTADEALNEAKGIVDFAINEFTIKEGLPFADDKTFVIASTFALAKFAARVVLPTATAAVSVVRLGVGYSLSRAQPRRKQYLAVHRSRVKASKVRSIRLKKIAPKGAPRLFVAGIMPMAMYGCEHHSMTKRNLSKLRNQAAAAGFVRPMGVSSLAKMLCQPTSNDPCFVAVSAPLTRWAIEAWLATGPERLRPRETA